MFILFDLFNISRDNRRLFRQHKRQVINQLNEGIFEYFFFYSKQSTTIHEVEINRQIKDIIISHKIFMKINNPIHTY